MNKFIKGALACALVVPCLGGLMGCTEKKEDKTEKAYTKVFTEVDTIASKFSSLETVGTELQLNINMSINAQQLINGVASPEGEIAAQLKAVLGAKHSQANKELFADISLVGEQNATTSILSAYVVDSIGEDEYTEIGTITETVWNRLKDVLYTESEGVYISAGTTYDDAAVYYMATEDLIHVYLNSNMSQLTNVIGFDVTELVPALSDGKLYGTIYTGEDVVEDNSQVGGGDVITGADSMIPEIPSVDDYESFKQSIADAGMTLTHIERNGDIGLSMSSEGGSIELIAKADGGLRMVVSVIMPTDTNSAMDIDMVIDIDVVDAIEESYIPSDLASYGEARDLEAWLGSLMGSVQ